MRLWNPRSLDLGRFSDVVYRDAARIRADYGIKTPDALHLATARHHDCTELWTNDDRLAREADGLAVNICADV